MMVMPTVELAKRHSKSKVAPSLREMPYLQSKIKDVADKRTGDQILMKEFPGGFWQFIGSNSAAAMRSVSIKYLIKDDLDGWESDVGGEGDPSEIIEKRTDAYSATSKILEISTPAEKELSRIEKSFLFTDQGYYYVPCPHCKQEQSLEWGGAGVDHGIKWDEGKPETAQYLCKHCHKLIPEYHKTYMLENGVWISKFPEIKLERGFKLNSLYSPIGWVSWAKIAQEFLKSKSIVEKLKVFVNTRLGDAWEEAGDRPDWIVIKGRAEPYRIIMDEKARIPERALIITAGIDVQKDRLACLFAAWGRGEECWVLWWGEIFGDPELPTIWEELDELLNRGYVHSSGITMHILCTAVDSGALTQIVYNYVRTHYPRVIATKGMSTPGKPILGHATSQDVNFKGKVIKGGVKLWPVGADTAKRLIYPRLRIVEPGPGRIHTPIGFDDDFYMQMVAEKLVTRFVKGFPIKEWILPSGRRNEVLDCMVLCYAAAVRIGLNRMPWDKLEQNMGRGGGGGDVKTEQNSKQPQPQPQLQPQPQSQISKPIKKFQSKYIQNFLSRK